LKLFDLDGHTLGTVGTRKGPSDFQSVGPFFVFIHVEFFHDLHSQ
jgi:hypothetical protein